MPEVHSDGLDIPPVFELCRKLSSISRYSQIKLLVPESVLEHTSFVTIFSIVFGMDVDKHLKAIGRPGINMNQLLVKAAVHDMEEVISGDIPRTTKYSNSSIRKEIARVEREGIDTVAFNISGDNLLLHDLIVDSWKNSKVGIEGAIIALADCAAVVYKAWWEVLMLNNRSMSESLVDLESYIDKSYMNLVSKLGKGDPAKLLEGVNQMKAIVRAISNAGRS